jgi:hypothetical protein
MGDLDRIVALAKDIDAELRRQNTSLEQLAAALNLASMASGGKSLPGPVNPVFTIGLPFSPEMLTEMLFAAPKEMALGIKGIFTITVTVPAASGPTPGQYILTLVPPPGYVTLFVSAFSFTATYYDPSITLDANIDGVDFTPPPYEFSFASAGTLESAKYSYVTSAAILTMTNPTTTPTTVTGKFEVIAIERNLFQSQFWLPLITLGINTVKAIASQQAL